MKYNRKYFAEAAHCSNSFRSVLLGRPTYPSGPSYLAWQVVLSKSLRRRTKVMHKLSWYLQATGNYRPLTHAYRPWAVGPVALRHASKPLVSGFLLCSNAPSYYGHCPRLCNATRGAWPGPLVTSPPLPTANTLRPQSARDSMVNY